MGNCNRRRSGLAAAAAQNGALFQSACASRISPCVHGLKHEEHIFITCHLRTRLIENGPSNPICTRRRAGARREPATRGSAGEATFGALFYPDLSGRDEAKPPRGRRPGARPPDPPPWPKRPTAPPRRIGTANGPALDARRSGPPCVTRNCLLLPQLQLRFLKPVISVTSTCVSKVLKPSTRLSKRHVYLCPAASPTACPRPWCCERPSDSRYGRRVIAWCIGALCAGCTRPRAHLGSA